jgi:LPS sulfotransferase NodH
MAFKVMWPQVRRTLEVSARRSLSGKVNFTELERRLAGNTRFVWLRRRDQEQQAISLNKAIQSNGWSSKQGGSSRRFSSLG